MNRASNRTLIYYILAAICIALLVLSSTGKLAPFEGVVSGAARPFLITFSGLGRQLNNAFNTIRDLRTLRAHNQSLQSLADTLTIDNLRPKEVESETNDFANCSAFAS
jgi:cell shape-determining protein MreC